MPKQYIRNLTAKTRTPASDKQLGTVLAFVAGAINAGGFIAVGSYTSHMTGIVSSIADSLALDHLALAGYALLYVLAFILGAATSSIVINWARAKNMQSEFALALLLESVLLLCFGAAAGAMAGSVPLIITLLCFIMGLQNAIITKISHAVIRTTHVTGLVTDIGIECGRAFYKKMSPDAAITLHPSQLRLHMTLLLAFLVGGIAGAFLFKMIGFSATLIFACLLTAMALLPVIDDVRARR